MAPACEGASTSACRPRSQSRAPARALQPRSEPRSPPSHLAGARGAHERGEHPRPEHAMDALEQAQRAGVRALRRHVGARAVGVLQAARQVGRRMPGCNQPDDTRRPAMQGASAVAAQSQAQAGQAARRPGRSRTGALTGGSGTLYSTSRKERAARVKGSAVRRLYASAAWLACGGGMDEQDGADWARRAERQRSGS